MISRTKLSPLVEHSVLARLAHVHAQLSPIMVRAVQGLDRGLGLVRGRERDEPEAARAARVALDGQVRVLDAPEGREERLEVRLRHLEGDVADVELAARAGLAPRAPAPEGREVTPDWSPSLGVAPAAPPLLLF